MEGREWEGKNDEGKGRRGGRGGRIVKAGAP
jgi:hypothetical protein